MVDSSASEDSEALTDDDVPLDERLRMVTISTQTPGTMLDYVHEFARRSSLSLVSLQDNRNQFWDHVLSCIKMPRGGLDGGGSQHCSFEFVAASEGVVQFIMEDLKVVQNQRYNMSLPPPHWEQSPSISTYCAIDSATIDSYFRLHRRHAARGRSVYRGSVLANPPDGYRAPVCLLCVCPPFLAELCHRKHGKLVLAVSFNLAVLNDQNLLTISPAMNYAHGMDLVLKERMLLHLKKMATRQMRMSLAFEMLVSQVTSVLVVSEGEWVPPPLSDMSLLGMPPVGNIDPAIDSGAESDLEDQASVRAAAHTNRACRAASSSKWAGRMRKV